MRFNPVFIKFQLKISTPLARSGLVLCLLTLFIIISPTNLNSTRSLGITSLNKQGLLSTIRLNQTTQLAQQDTVVKSLILLPPNKPGLLAAVLHAAAALRSA